MTVETLQFESRGQRYDFRMDLDMGFMSDRWIFRQFCEKGGYEPEVSRALARIVRSGDTVIDIGANVGYFTLLMSRIVGNTGHVYAFEPGGNNVPKLQANLALNKTVNVRVFETALSDKEEVAPFWLSADNSGGNALWDPGHWFQNEKSRARPEKTMVQTERLDHQLIENPRVIKIDTEGAETRILRGAVRLLKEYKTPFILAEINLFGLQELGSSAPELRRLMADMGYDTFLLYPNGELPKMIPRNLDPEFPGTVNVLFSTPASVGRAWSDAPL